MSRDYSDDKIDGNNALLALIVGGAALYWWYQQQQQQAAAMGVDNTLEGDIDSASSAVANYVAANVQGQTRGERNNNPGNIRKTVPPIPWQGLAPVQTDPDFSQFVNPLYGIRALHLNLLTYYNTHGYKTIQSIISAWAPPKPPDNNNTGAYIAFVSNKMGIGTTTVLDLTDTTTAMSLVDAIITKENGRDIYAGNGQLAAAMAMT
jgi:hypothetical protein